MGVIVDYLNEREKLDVPELVSEENSDIDTQTKNITQGINLLLSYYPEAKLLTGYDQEIVMILPYKDRVVAEELEDKLISLGWEHLKFVPWMWEYRVEGCIYNYHKEPVNC